MLLIIVTYTLMTCSLSLAGWELVHYPMLLNLSSCHLAILTFSITFCRREIRELVDTTLKYFWEGKEEKEEEIRQVPVKEQKRIL